MSKIRLPRLVLSDVHMTAAPPGSARGGLVGFASCVVNGSLRVDGIAVRRSWAGGFLISFPTRKDVWGRKHAILRPMNDRVRADFEFQILDALGLAEDSRR